jgi:hypothetical protein
MNSFWLKALAHGIKAVGYATFEDEAAATKEKQAPYRTGRAKRAKASRASSAGADPSCCTATRSVPLVRPTRGGTKD